MINVLPQHVVSIGVNLFTISHRVAQMLALLIQQLAQTVMVTMLCMSLKSIKLGMTEITIPVGW
jgi:hypothetical protein